MTSAPPVPPPFVVQVPLRWVDQDAQGHVNNALVADYLQEARIAFLLGGDNAHMVGGGGLVAAHQVEFLRPIAFSTRPVAVELNVGKVGAAQFTLGSQVRQGGELAARARTRLAITDPSTGAPRRMTPTERAWYERRSTTLEPLPDLGRWRVGEAAFEEDFHVRWSDLDPYDHVDNVRVFDMIAEGRIRMDATGSGRTRMQDAAERGLMWMVVRQDLDYLVPLTYRLEPYRVRTACAKVGRTSMTLAAQVVDPATGTVHARSLTVLVCSDASGRPVPVPPSVPALAARWPAVPKRTPA